ncbi:trehalase family glycosidase [Actinoplanes sichuanensis]|uniref:Amylo-alpha-1,6-glucosidase n=1 Tax=Actinoplanes sichuanensis TaxID=512349 RepID=A0ABW4ATT6_9ACTN|nr:glycogen debranching protein [Actinoplanes sichuanensis]BEL04391.1 trehalase family glycosidase [Actinoplanes sichuanensis]
MTVVPIGPAFAVQDIPFSHRGSWFGISPVIAENIVADDLHLVSHRNGMHAILRFIVLPGATVAATPALLSWHHDDGRIDLVFDDQDTIRVRGHRLGLDIVAAAGTLTPFSGTYLYQDPVDGSHVFTSYETGRRYRVTVLTGDLEAVDGQQTLGTTRRGLTLPPDGEWELAIEEFGTARRPYRSRATFDELHRRAQTTFTAFADAVAPWRSPATPAAELAAYVLWSATVDPAGFVTRPAVLMSKHWMDKVWSWDHCFNALALAAGEPDLARHQFQLPFDHQDDSGALPDSITHAEVLHNFVKPPIHGWAWQRLRHLGLPVTRQDLTQTYERLAAWTRFWLDFRRAPGHALPHYQHGNDSGWDNATTFDGDRVIESADLAAFLILQLRCLAELATELGDDAAPWTAIADEIRAAMLDQLWNGERFEARGVLSGARQPSTSLLDLMPIVLGDELPAPITAALARGIELHLTAYGPATEPVTSADYAADGYWRGPIWAPSTILIEDGLRRAGHSGLADEISERFRALCERSGFAENFDAETGAGLRDRAYTWTASSYLILAAAHERRRSLSG